MYRMVDGIHIAVPQLASITWSSTPCRSKVMRASGAKVAPSTSVPSVHPSMLWFTNWLLKNEPLTHQRQYVYYMNRVHHWQLFFLEKYSRTIYFLTMAITVNATDIHIDVQSTDKFNQTARLSSTMFNGKLTTKPIPVSRIASFHACLLPKFILHRKLHPQARCWSCYSRMFLADSLCRLTCMSCHSVNLSRMMFLICRCVCWSVIYFLY